MYVYPTELYITQVSANETSLKILLPYGKICKRDLKKIDLVKYMH